MFLIPVVILLPMVMAILAACLSKRSPFLRDALVVGTGIATFGICVLLAFQGESELTIPGVCGFGLTFQADGFRAIYGCIAAFIAPGVSSWATITKLVTDMISKKMKVVYRSSE